MSIFTGKTLMITGGTGSFGNAVLNRFLRTDIGEIRIFSRLSSLLVMYVICNHAVTLCQALTISSTQQP